VTPLGNLVTGVALAVLAIWAYRFLRNGG